MGVDGTRVESYLQVVENFEAMLAKVTESERAAQVNKIHLNFGPVSFEMQVSRV